MEVFLLGPLEVTTSDGPVEIAGARLRSLLARLALEPDQAVGADALVESLWGASPPTDAANALQSLVSRLRRLLPDGVLVSAPGGYRLAIAPSCIDVHRFERLAAEGHRALAAGDPAAAVTELDRAQALWRGRPLADLGDSLVADVEAGRLEELRLTTYEDLVDARLALGAVVELVPGLEAASAEHPLRERLRAGLVLALYAAGRQADALAAYEQTRRLLADELGVDPGPQLRAAHLAVLRGQASTSPMPSASSPGARTARSNMRSQLTSFVGREDEVARVEALLKEHRLVTVVGPGGAGKTRLAVEVGARLADGQPNGVWLVELASVTDPDDLPQAVLGSLGLREVNLLDTGRPLEARDALGRLLAAVADKQALVVLDNCEHLLDAVASLADRMLADAPRLRVLATSREPLGIVGEALASVPPLGQPATGASPEEALRYSSVQLFADRAAAVRPGFVVDGSTVGDVVEICRRLDGLPLAIELAAARLRSMSTEQVAARLGDRFRLLTGGNRTAVPRHRTLRAVVEWSWDLLSDPERGVAERLSVFPAGATPDAVEALCDDLAPGESLDVAAALVEKSLLVLVDGSPPRYRMLETIREYGTERLVEAGEITAVRTAHARWCRDLAEAAEPLLRTSEQLPWIARLSDERDNMLAALRFSVDSGDASGAVRLAAALAWFWTLRGMHAEAAVWLGLALEVPGDTPPAERAMVAVAYVMSALSSAPDPVAAARAEALLAAVPDEQRMTSHPVLVLGDVGMALFTDDDQRALAGIERGRAHPDPWTQGALRMMHGLVAENDGDVATMREELTSAHAIFEGLQERWGLGMTLAALGSLYLTDGEDDRALAAFEKSLEFMRELDADEDASHVVIRIALARARTGDLEGARTELRAVVDSSSEQSLGFDTAFATYGLAEVARLEGDRAESRRLCEEALVTMAAGVGPPQIRSVVLTCLAYLDIDEGNVAGARERLALAYEVVEPVRDMPIVAQVAVTAAAVAMSSADARVAADLLGVARRVRGSDDRGSVDAERVTRAALAELGEQVFTARFDAWATAPRADALAHLVAHL